MDIKKLTIDAVKSIFEDAGGEWGEVNLFGLRNEASQESDLFNDFIGICSGDIIKVYAGTTDPGAWWTLHPVTASGVTGAAHLCEGFHKNAWRVGVHAQGTPFAHEALVQTGNKVKIWRDLKNNFTHDDGDPEQSGYFGINIHRAGLDDPTKIGKYSAGCQVVRHHKDFDELMGIIKASENFKKNKAGARFSYLLLNIKSL